MDLPSPYCQCASSGSSLWVEQRHVRQALGGGRDVAEQRRRGAQSTPSIEVRGLRQAGMEALLDQHGLGDGERLAGEDLLQVLRLVGEVEVARPSLATSLRNGTCGPPPKAMVVTVIFSAAIVGGEGARSRRLVAVAAVREHDDVAHRDVSFFIRS